MLPGYAIVLELHLASRNETVGVVGGSELHLKPQVAKRAKRTQHQEVDDGIKRESLLRPRLLPVSDLLITSLSSGVYPVLRTVS